MNYQLEIKNLLKELNELKNEINVNNFQIQEYKDLLEVPTAFDVKSEQDCLLVEIKTTNSKSVKKASLWGFLWLYTK